MIGKGMKGDLREVKPFREKEQLLRLAKLLSVTEVGRAASDPESELLTLLLMKICNRKLYIWKWGAVLYYCRSYVCIKVISLTFIP